MGFRGVSITWIITTNCTTIQTLFMANPYLLLHSLSDGHTNAIASIKFSPTCEFLATGDEDGVISIWNPQNSLLLNTIRVKSPVLVLEWDPTRRQRLFYGCESGVVAYMDGFVGVRSTCSLYFFECSWLVSVPNWQTRAHPVQTGVDNSQVYAISVNSVATQIAISLGPEIHIANYLANGKGAFFFWKCSSDY